jgi:hypothetical protein
MNKCLVKYGVDIEPLQSDSPITVGSIRRNGSLKDALGYGDNVNILINGVTMSDDHIVPPNATVVIETAANTKAVPA